MIQKLTERKNLIKLFACCTLALSLQFVFPMCISPSDTYYHLDYNLPMYLGFMVIPQIIGFLMMTASLYLKKDWLFLVGSFLQGWIVLGIPFLIMHLRNSREHTAVFGIITAETSFIWAFTFFYCGVLQSNPHIIIILFMLTELPACFSLYVYSVAYKTFPLRNKHINVNKAMEKLNDLIALRDKGILTQEEFEKLKAQIFVK